MSDFSDLLSMLIKSKNIKVYNMVQYCDLDRSTMYKIINGKRNPSSFELVKKLAKYMNLTPHELEEFYKAYYISIIGKDIYLRRKSIFDFIYSFGENDPCQKTVIELSSTPNLLSSDNKNTISCEGRTDINNTIHNILTHESSKKDGYIDLLVQPDYSFLFEFLATILKKNRSFHVRHIFCLDNQNRIMHDLKNYNLQCFKNIIPLYKYSYNYTSFYYYGTIHSQEITPSLLPNLLLTRDYCLTFSADREYGILYQDPHIIEIFKKLFEDYLSMTSPFINQSFQHTMGLNNQNILNKKSYIFQAQPCFLPVFPEYFLDKYIKKDLPDRKNIIDKLKQYLYRQTNIMKTFNVHCIFTKKGVEDFFKKGNITEFANNICNPLDIKDRILLLKRFADYYCRREYFMMQEEICKTLNHISIYINNQRGCLMYTSSKYGITHLTFEEPDLVLAFYDFMESLNDKKNFYETKEIMDYLDVVIKKGTGLN